MDKLFSLKVVYGFEFRSLSRHHFFKTICMKKSLKVRLLENRINNAVSKIRDHYPHLYYSVGGRYIRKVLRGMYQGDDSKEELNLMHG